MEAIKEEQLTILDEQGVNQPAWRHEDGTIVSHWDGLSKLLIHDEYGIREIDHSVAKELGYEE